MIKSPFLFFATLATFACASPGEYSSVVSLSGHSFLNAFQWQTISDPTHGRVNYVDAGTAWSTGLVWVSGNTVGLRADYTTFLNPGGPGRNSFRLQSVNTYSEHVAIFDIGHMPEGCGTWPAVSLYFFHGVYREVGANWPNGGEIDIVEGVNNQSPNQATLHTGPNCAQPSNRWQYGMSMENNCDVYATNNVGCGVRFADPNSFGPGFNKNGGGWYAVERSASHIKVWFWARNSGYVPNEVKYPGGNVTPEHWGEPSAYFYDTDCNIAAHFGPMNIIINLTFCGDWAGNTYGSSECPSDCIDFVNYNPGAFSNAYFEFNSLHIYE